MLPIPPWLLIAFVTVGVVLGTVAYLILLERKVASWTQDRVGPNRVGPGGMLQPIADGLKMFVKEDYRPAGADKIFFTLGPALIMLVVVVAMAVIPWGGIVGERVSLTVPADVAPNAAIEQQLPRWRQAFDAEVQQAPVDRHGDSLAGLVRMDRPNGFPITVQYTQGWAFQIANLNLGVLFIVAVLSLAVYGIVLGGWASNNKYSFLGGLRATAQMISYEVPLGLSLLTVVLLFGTLDLGQIIDKQAHYWVGFIPAWNVFCQPLAFVMFLICIHAEANRAPFDLAEAEQELVGGYHTEFSSMRMGLLLLAEYAEIIVTSSVCVALFFGGWHLPGLGGNVDPAHPAVTSSILIALLRAVVFFVKVLVVIFVFMWVRWSLPRFRFDQLMLTAWRALVPLSLGLLMVTSLIIYWFGGSDRAFMRIGAKLALALLIGNVVVVAAAMLISRLLPVQQNVNRQLKVLGSRFDRTPLPAGEADVETAAAGS